MWNGMGMRRQKILLLTLAFNLATSQAMAYAPDDLNLRGRELSLQEAISIALRYNPNVRNAYLARTLAKFDLRVSKRSYQPIFGFSASSNFSSTKASSIPTDDATPSLTPISTTQDNLDLSAAPTVSLNTPIGGKLTSTLTNANLLDGYTPSLSLGYSQPLLKGAGSRIAQLDLRTAYNAERISRLSLKQSIIQQVDAVISDYYALVSAENILKNNILALKDAKQQLEINQAKIRAGQMAPNESVSTAADIAQRQVDVTSQENAIFGAKMTLLKDLGITDIKATIRVPTTVAVKIEKVPDLDESVRLALKNNITYQTDLLNFNQTRFDLLSAKDNMRWSLDLNVNARWGGSGDEGLGDIVSNRHRSYSYGLTLTAPLTDLSLQRTLLAKKIGYQEALDRIKQDKFNLMLDVRTRVNALRDATRQIAQANESVRLAQESYRLEEKKVSLGLSNNVLLNTQRAALTTAQNSLNTAKISYITALKDYRTLLGITLKAWNIKVKYW